MNNVSYITITQDVGSGQRVDNFLMRHLKNVPKSKIYNILRRGEVRVNKGRIKPCYKLQENDIVRVPPITQTEQRQVTAQQVANINITTLYEDQNLLIVHKPTGLAVHGGSGLSFGLIELLRVKHPEHKVLELVHRLDRDTSGCIMLAKNNAMLRALHDLLQEHQINKIYHCLVHGFAPDSFTVDAPLKKNTLSSGERIVKINPEEGKPSITEFKVLKRYNGATLLQAEPITGRTHQIRVHAAQRGLPIIGDQKYGDQRRQRAKRLFLHAYQLNFKCPITDKRITVTAEYDQSWKEGIAQYDGR